MNANLFRRHERAHDAMARASMPRTSAADPAAPVASDPELKVTARVWNNGRVAAKLAPLTFKLSEVADV